MTKEEKIKKLMEEYPDLDYDAPLALEKAIDFGAKMERDKIIKFMDKWKAKTDEGSIEVDRLYLAIKDMSATKDRVE